MSETPPPSEAAALRERGIEAVRHSDTAAAERLFTQAFEAGHHRAGHDLADLLWDLGDKAGAWRWWRRAAEAGVPESAFETGYAADKNGDPAEAERWYRVAAEGGDMSGLLNLGVLLENRGDMDEAMALYHRAWDLGSDQAAFNIGKFHDADGKGDLAVAAEWYGRAAERGNAGAAYNLGHVRQDQGETEKQMEAWHRAAELGHPKAALSLGTVLMNQGDDHAAAQWLTRSVREFGHEAAAARLAGLYQRRGDEGTARFWREFPGGLGAYSPAFERFAAEGSAAAIHRQDVLNAFLGDGHVELDLTGDVCAVGGRTFGGTTVLGSFSRLSGTWLWSWDNTHIDRTLPSIARLEVIREFGERHRIPELTAGTLDFSGFPDPESAAKTMAIAVGELLGGNGVHACSINGGQGSAVFHLDDPALPVAEYDHLAASRLLLRAFEVFPADHRRVARGFMARNGFQISESAEVIEGRSEQGHRLAVGFTAEGRHTTISSGAPES
ncbi:SEL1-like repeat protein [Spirillospora sp. CA-294931]|uniref:SEL1-like repeat protein n=1 Tax=Spirillospora sp. CA-294931 TaxID=3240042 RepID=UPI003D8F6784